MKHDYAGVFKDERAVEKYADELYASGTYASIVSERQGTWLRRLVATTFPGTPPVLHDFACGTGRVMRFLADVVTEAHGYDTSAAMIDRARADGVKGEFHLIDEDGPLPTPVATDSPALVTAFRFLLNTSEQARDRTVAFAAAALPAPESGLLLLENHGHRRSLRHLLNSRRRHEWFNELSTADVEALLRRHGFELVSSRAFTLVPRRAYRGRLRAVVEPVDRLAVRLPGAAVVAVDVVHVARRVA